MASLCSRRLTLAGSPLCVRQQGRSPASGFSLSPSLTDGSNLPTRWSVIVAQKRYLQRHRVPVETLREAYTRAKETSHSYTDISQADAINPKGIFANNLLRLEEVDVYGFDYDYTLALYKKTLDGLIFNLGVKSLVEDFRYPREILDLEYVPNFAIRGLHYDIRKGWALKLDTFLNIQKDTVYRGFEVVEKEEVLEHYEGGHVSLTKLGNYYGKGPDLVQSMDFFAVPEIALLAKLTQFFLANKLDFVPQYVYYDVRNAIETLHKSGRLHNKITDNIELYLRKHPQIPILLNHLRSNDKKVFLITNSPFHFVDKGMKYIVGDGWEELFDVLVLQARKPKFFAGSTRPFREFKPDGGEHWQQVTSLEKGKFYIQGNLELFRNLTGWKGSRVLYFGDHVYADLADAAMQHGWRTAAIIPEIENEVRIMTSPKCLRQTKWLVALQDLIQDAYWERDNPEVMDLLVQWKGEKEILRKNLKELYNPYFGSIFRAYENPTYFARRLGRFADIYMSSVVNLLDYPIDYSFYVRRSPLPHEYMPFQSSSIFN